MVSWVSYSSLESCFEPLLFNTSDEASVVTGTDWSCGDRPQLHIHPRWHLSLAAEYDEPDSKQGTVEATPYLGTVHVGVFPAIKIGDTQIPQIISAMGHTSGEGSLREYTVSQSPKSLQNQKISLKNELKLTKSVKNRPKIARIVKKCPYKYGSDSVMLRRTPN
jgi:hypothetical protein